MGKQISLNRFNEVLNHIGAILLPEIKAKVKRKKWSHAYIEVLWPSSGVDEGGLGKCRVQLADGSSLGLDPPIQATLLMNEAWRLQKGLFPGTWYELKVTMLPNGKCEADFNYDRDCLKKNADAFLSS